MRFFPESIHVDVEFKELSHDLGVELLQPGASDDEDSSTTSKINSPASSHVNLYDMTTPSPVRGFPVHKHTDYCCSCQQVKELQPSKEPFQSLTNEVILSVFQWLPLSSLLSCARVCKRWKMLAYDDSLWRQINLTRFHFPPGTLGKVLERGCTAVKLAQASVNGPLGHSESPKIQSLRRGTRKRRHSQQVTPSQLAIEYLDLSICKIDDDLLYDLLTRCHKLRKLSLESCQVNKDVLSAIGNLSVNTLEDLNLCMCTGITQNAINQLLVCCKSLNSLNLAWCDLKSASCINSVVSWSSDTLKNLNISGYRNHMTDDEVKLLVQNFPNLVDLDLSDSSITKDSVHLIASFLKKLRHVSLSRCYGIEQYSLVKLGCLKDLQAIEVFGTISEAALKSMNILLPHIRFNSCPFSAIARPTTRTVRKNYIWNVKCWD
ncbi:S-phase kinase-associated protein 2-like isoform X2 [Anneissia japonica]|nr:S-phase kinase-associated protein 2-like isoform X2 [Anneissia japonica]